MRLEARQDHAFMGERGSILLGGILLAFAITLVGLGLFQAGVIETRNVASTESNPRVFYAAESGLSRAALDAATNVSGSLATPPNTTLSFDTVKASLNADNTTPSAYYGSTCFGSTSCTSSTNPKSPAYLVQAVNSSDTDKFWLYSTACVPGPAANPCATSSAAVAQVRALIKKTVSSTTTTTTTTVPEFQWGAFGGNSMSLSGGFYNSYNSHCNGVGGAICDPGSCSPSGTGLLNTTRLGSNGTGTSNSNGYIQTSGTVSIGGSVIGTTDQAGDPKDVSLSSGTTVTGGIVESGGNVVIGGTTNPATSSQVDSGAATIGTPPVPTIQPNSPTPQVTLNALPNCSPYAASLPLTAAPGYSCPSTVYNSSTHYLNISGNTTKCVLATGNYCLGQVNIQSSGELQISGPVVITVSPGTGGSPNGFFEVQSSGVINNTTKDPEDFQVISTYNGTNNNAVLINSASVSYMTIYAPTAPVTLQGGGTLFGAVIGKSITATGNSAICYDAFLGSGNANLTNAVPTTTTTITTIPGPTTYSLLSWEKCSYSGSSWVCS